jgi:hypothetical protein
VSWGKYNRCLHRVTDAQLLLKKIAKDKIHQNRFNLQITVTINFCNFIQQQLRADDFQISTHRQDVAVGSNYKMTHLNA